MEHYRNRVHARRELPNPSYGRASLLRPLLVALVLGIVTDYVVFYLANAEVKTLQGRTRLEAAQGATAETTPIVLAASASVIRFNRRPISHSRPGRSISVQIT